MPYYCYLARCADDSLYCGTCKDIKEREATHNSGKGAKYTRSRLPVNIIYFEECASQSDALKREAAIKKLSREEKLRLLH